MPKNVYFKAKSLFIGWGKYRKINNSRIIGQGNFFMLCLVNDVKVNLGV